ncbi:MAG: DUF2309 domain-containing protein [Gammaproteobacteria bacterium]|nr:DUF2309 domain-containing protein [Gammaproteobacteria bacterium]
MEHTSSDGIEIREQLRSAIARFEHVLPGQAPIRNFVHHNTLHGYQHLLFPEALELAEKKTGARGYLPEERYREFFEHGRISREELERVLDESPELQADELLFDDGDRSLTRREVYLNALLHPIEPVTACQFNWQIEELQALQRFQPDVPALDRQRLLAEAARFGMDSEQEAITDLWGGCLEKLGLTHYLLHPEDLVDLDPEQAERMLVELLAGNEESDSVQRVVDRRIRKESEVLLNQTLERVGEDLTLRGLLQLVTGQDVLELLEPGLFRQLASYLDQGTAAWHSEDNKAGFYHAWRSQAALDLNWVFEELPDWKNHLESLPDDPMDTLITELRRLGLSQKKWVGYLECLALELPGWSGMFLWRSLHPDSEGDHPGRVEMIDYLAVRLVAEHLYAQRLCADLWQLEASLDMLRWYFRRHAGEFLVRYTLYGARLPEYLATLAQRFTRHSAGGNLNRESWWLLAGMVHTWRHSPAADQPVGYSVYTSAWCLFRLSQHLGLSGGQVRSMEADQLQQVLNCLERLTPGVRGFIWLQAYETHYRDQVFNGLIENHGRAPHRVSGPSAQLVFCMDDREEGMRRHLEELAPDIETFGAAAHFNVPNLWKGVDDSTVTPLTPVVITPCHVIGEHPVPGQEPLKVRRDKRRQFRFRIGNILQQEIRRNLLSSALLIGLAAPGALFTSIGKVINPAGFGKWVERLRQRFEPSLETELHCTAETTDEQPTPENPRQGFTTKEQVDRLEIFLRNIGLLEGFSPLVVIMAHGSDSQNNPHLAAYDCGACSGRHSGPNARILAALANRKEVRRELAIRGISISESCWFLGTEHNTCSEGITWYDLAQMPESFDAGLATLRSALDEARARHAHERCRRLASAPDAPTMKEALDHVIGRGLDFSQARPELGHATNAAAVIGRRSLTRGAFFDRRVFLISYDPETDPEGGVLERLLLANAPVGAGINLEYYFSTVDNVRYGCGSKVTHNVAGFFGVMEGSASDLRTGLPRQMIEIHEAMRLQVVVEARVEILTRIYTRQPALQELVGNGWLLLSAIHPETGNISVFKPSKGFFPWEGARYSLPSVDCSIDWYRGHDQPLSPALVADRPGGESG